MWLPVLHPFSFPFNLRVSAKVEIELESGMSISNRVVLHRRTDLITKPLLRLPLLALNS
jgi:hypothetical protein